MTAAILALCGLSLVAMVVEVAYDATYAANGCGICARRARWARRVELGAAGAAFALLVAWAASLIPWDAWVRAGRVMAAVGIYGGLVLVLLGLVVLLAAVPGRRS